MEPDAQPRSEPPAGPDRSLELRLAAAAAELRRATAEHKRLELKIKGLAGALREQADAHLETLDRLQQREEEALRRSEERFQRLLESAGEAIFGIEEEGRLTFVNPAGARMIETDATTLFDRRLRDVLSHAHDDGLPCRSDDCPIEAPLRTHAESSGEATLQIHGRTVPVEYTSTPIREDGAVTGAVVVLRDVTERRRIDEYRTRLLHDLEAGVAARDDFLSIASHELRTPLTPLRFQVHALKRALAAGPVTDIDALKKRADGIEKQIDRMQRLIEQLLDVSRITVGRLELQRERVDLAAMVRDVAVRMKPEFAAAGSDARVDAAEPIVGEWDALRVEQVVTNLVSNAVKYGQGRPIEISVSKTGSAATLRVCDHGIGIAPEDKQRIFDRFERLVSVRHFGGFGLGLWIVRQIVQAHGGSIQVDSAPGEGSTFTVRLPLTTTAAGPAPPPDSSDAGAS